MKPVFVDTSAFVALANKKDKSHVSARRFLRSLARSRRPLVTSTDIADEVVTLARMRLGHRVAVEVGVGGNGVFVAVGVGGKVSEAKEANPSK